ncbi:MAG: GNAT family N-acetyltransferase [Pseudomonadota bacterium]
MPELHSSDAYTAYFRDVVFRECAVWVAEARGTLVGFCASREDWIDHLYLLPDYVGQSIGATLLEKAKAGQASLQLWVFQQNTKAQRFYARHGFRKVKETDGASNAEKTPDALFEWHAP